MSKVAEDERDSDLRDEYDFSGGVRGTYAERYASGTNVVPLDPDVAEVFPDSESVNRALRVLADLVRQQVKKATDEAR